MSGGGEVAGPEAKTQTSSDYARGLCRAFGGAVIFGVPLMMTQEMWSLGFTIGRGRLLLFMAANLAVLVGLSYFAGFEKTFRLRDDLMDALAAFAVGSIASAAALLLFAVLTPEMSLGESVGKIALQSVPASIGAMLGSKQLGGGEDTGADETEKRDASYGGELFLMLVGALFLAFNIAPTEEVQLIAFQMTPFHALALGLVSLGLMHAFVYAIGFKGQESVAEGSTVTAAVLTYTIPGYAVALAMSFFVLWTFGRTDDVGLAQIATMTVVLGFPAAIGAATARLVI